IGGTSVAQAKLQPRLVLTDQSVMLCVRPQLKAPIVYLPPNRDCGDACSAAESANVGPNPTDLQRTERTGLASRQIALSGCDLWLPQGFESDHGTARDFLAHLALRVDLGEPFERIHEAIREAQRLGGRGQEAHGQAA